MYIVDIPKRPYSPLHSFTLCRRPNAQSPRSPTTVAKKTMKNVRESGEGLSTNSMVRMLDVES